MVGVSVASSGNCPEPLEVRIIPFPHFCDAQMQLAFPSSPTQSPSILLSCTRPPASPLDPPGSTANPTALAGGSSVRTGMLPPASRPCGLGAGVIPRVGARARAGPAVSPAACSAPSAPALWTPAFFTVPKRSVLSSSPSSAPGLPRAVCVTSGKSTNGSPPSTSVPGPLFLLPPLQGLPAHPESPLSLGSSARSRGASSMARAPGFPPPDCLVWITDVDAHLFLCRESRPEVRGVGCLNPCASLTPTRTNGRETRRVSEDAGAPRTAGGWGQEKAETGVGTGLASPPAAEHRATAGRRVPLPAPARKVASTCPPGPPRRRSRQLAGEAPRGPSTGEWARCGRERE